MTEMLAVKLDELDPGHATALRWFQDHQGQTIPWSAIIAFVDEDGGSRLVTQAKGIYKPKGIEYAVSVRQTLDSPYADKEVETRPDGSWVYPYFQENPDPAQRDREFTNRGLMKSMEDEVPVGVMLQTKPKPGVEYRILGLARVTEWRDGYFILESIADEEELKPRTPAAIDAARERALSSALAPDPGSFDPTTVEDLRRSALAQVARRRGQAAFRAALIEAYGGHCAVTDCDAVEALEAAHITPFLGDETNHPQNGILLRADIHSLFDLGLIAIDPESMVIVLHPQLRGSSYRELADRQIRVPDQLSAQPSREALGQHLDWSGLAT